VIRRLAAAACLAVAAAAATVIVGGPATAASVQATGWWWQAQGTVPGVALPTPPTTPSEGLMVAGTPDGPKAVAAIRITLDKAETAPVLTLKVAQGSEVNGSDGIVNAYPATSDWKPAKAGAFADRPQYDPAGASVVGVRASDGGAYRFDLSSLVKDGKLDVVLAPGKLAVDVPISPTFQVAFDAPDAAAIAQSSQVVGEPAPEASVSPADATAAAPTTSSDTGSAAATVNTGGSASSGAPDVGTSVGSVPSSSPAPPIAGVPVPDTGVAAGTGPRTDTVAASAVARSRKPVRNAKPLAVAVLLAALAGAAYALMQRPEVPRTLSRFARPAPVPAGVAVAGAPVGGLAQFRRARDGAPPPLL
jgi:hypothetical protein